LFRYLGQAALAGALLASVNVFAVDLDAGPVVPALYAKEIKGPSNLTGAALDLLVKTGYSEADGEVRYLRFELAPTTAKWIAVTTPAVTLSPAQCILGAINGMGTNAIYVSLTATPGGGGCPATAQVSLMGVTIGIADTASDVSATFGVYVQPSQAAAGGATGRIVTK